MNLSRRCFRQVAFAASVTARAGTEPAPASRRFASRCGFGVGVAFCAPSVDDTLTQGIRERLRT